MLCEELSQEQEPGVAIVGRKERRDWAEASTSERVWLLLDRWGRAPTVFRAELEEHQSCNESEALKVYAD
ncbi:Catenin Alpha-3 [Manis pentadactyla]|nr:Catenin Alpha-3 [Manis pentadactyla]